MIQMPLSPPDLKRYKDLHMGYVLLDEAMATTFISYDEALLQSYEVHLRDFIYIRSGGIYRTIEKSSVIGFLKEFEGVPASDFVNKDVESSLAEEVMTKIAAKGLAAEFVAMYSEYTSLKSSLGNFRNLYNSGYSTDQFSISGHRLRRIDYKLADAVTGRVYTREQNIQNIAYRYLPTISVPAGYIIQASDFDQIEPRLQYYLMYRDTTLDESYMYAKDTYEFMFNVMSPSNTDLFTKKFRNDYFKTAFLATVYGQDERQTAAGMGNPAIAKDIHRWLENNESRQSYMRKLQTKIDAGGTINIVTFFGNRISIDLDSENSSAHALFKKLVNYPVQATAHEIVAHYALMLYDRAAAQGINIQIYFSRHDEPLFVVPVEHLGAYKQIVDELSVIEIADWKPMTVDTNFSFNYKGDLEGLNTFYIPCATIEPEEINRILLKPPTTYFPISSELHIDLYYKIYAGTDDAMYTLMYAACSNNKVYGGIARDRTPLDMANILLQDVVSANIGFDYVISTPLPVMPIIEDALHVLKHENVPIAFTAVPRTQEDINHQVTSTILKRVMDKNPQLSELIPNANAFDFQFVIKGVQFNERPRLRHDAEAC